MFFYFPCRKSSRGKLCDLANFTAALQACLASPLARNVGCLLKRAQFWFVSSESDTGIVAGIQSQGCLVVTNDNDIITNLLDLASYNGIDIIYCSSGISRTSSASLSDRRAAYRRHAEIKDRELTAHLAQLAGVRAAFSKKEKV